MLIQSKWFYDGINTILILRSENFGMNIHKKCFLKIKFDSDAVKRAKSDSERVGKITSTKKAPALCDLKSKLGKFT